MLSENEIIEYIERLPNSDSFTAISTDKQQAYIFDAIERFQHYFRTDDIHLTPRIVALQTLHQLEGDGEEFGKLKAHGVSSYSVKDVSVSFNENSQSFHPDALVMFLDINPKLIRRGRVGRLI